MIRGTATSATFALLLSVATAIADQPLCGDENARGSETHGDAPAELRTAPGQQVQPECPAPAMTLKTGQTVFYDSSGTEIACAEPARRRAVQRDVRRSFTDNGDGTISDNLTGLMWMKVSDAARIRDEEVRNWENESGVNVAARHNLASFAGHNDWRPPTHDEMKTLVHNGAVSPTTYSPFDTDCAPGCTSTSCNCKQADTYWSPSTYHVRPSAAWYIYYHTRLHARGQQNE